MIEGCRKTLVGAMKTGSMFVLYLGHATVEHADWKTKLCKKVCEKVMNIRSLIRTYQGIFPFEVFESAGERLKAPPFNPRFLCYFCLNICHSDLSGTKNCFVKMN